MDPRAAALALGAAAIHAGWNLRLHRDSDRLASIIVALFVGGALLSPWLVLDFPAQVLALVVLSALAEAAYSLALATAYSHGQLAIAYPIGRGIAPLLVTLGAIAVLGQMPAPLAAIGTALLFGGLILVASGGRGQARAIGYAILTGSCVATYSVIDAGAVRHANPMAYLSAVLLLGGVLLSLALRIDLQRLRRAFPSGAAIGVGSTAAYALVLLAFQLAPAGRVATLRETAVIIGVLVARERRPRRVLVGAMLVVLGAICAGT